MASLNDVQNAMVNIINAAMYPNGTSSPSIAGVPIYVKPGDFLKANLDQGLAAGDIFVAVFAVNGMTRSTTRVRRDVVDQKINNPQLTLTVFHNTVIVGGTIAAGEAAMVISHGTGYSAPVLVGSTLNSIAAALAALIPGASALNNIVTVSGDYHLSAYVSVQGTGREIYFSRESIMRARVIAPNHAQRELVGDALELAFGANGYYMMMPDKIAASIKPNRIMELNPYELANSFVRDYLYLVEYHTVNVQNYQSIADPYAVITTGVLSPP